MIQPPLSVCNNTTLSLHLQATNTATDHIPSTMYDYEIFVTQPTPCNGIDHTSSNKQVQKDTTVNNYHADVHRRSQSVDAVHYRSHDNDYAV